MPTLRETIPILAVRDLGAAVAFYADKLGFLARHQESGSAIVCRDQAEIHLTQLNDDSWPRGPTSRNARSHLAPSHSYQVRAPVESASRALTTCTLNTKRVASSIRRASFDFDGNGLTFFERRQLRVPGSRQ